MKQSDQIRNRLQILSLFDVYRTLRLIKLGKKRTVN